MAVVMAGFVDFHITHRVDVFTGAPHEGSAVNYGTLRITAHATRRAKALRATLNFKGKKIMEKRSL